MPPVGWVAGAALPGGIPEEDVLKTMKVPELAKMCTEYGLDKKGVKADLVGRLTTKRAEVLAEMGEVPGGEPPGPDDDPREGFMASCGSDGEIMAVINRAFPGGLGPECPSAEGVWVCAAVAKELGAPVSRATMAQLEVTFLYGGEDIEMMAMEVAKCSPQYLPMRNALTTTLVGHVALPDGVTIVQARQAVATLMNVCAPQAVTAAAAPTAADFAAAVERMANTLKESLTVQGKEGGAGGAKVTTVEVQEAMRVAGDMGYPVTESDLPRLEQLSKMRGAVLARAGEAARPGLPVSQETQPPMLKALQDERGQYAAEETQLIGWDEERQQQVLRAASAPVKGYTRTAYSVAQGHMMYWHAVLLLATMIKDLPEQPDDEGAVTRKKGVWLHSYYVIKFGKMLSAVVGRQTLTGPGLDELLRPLLQEAQSRVNHKGMSADVALAWIIEEMPVRLATVAASKTENDARRQREKEPANKKRKLGEEKDGKPPYSGVYKQGQTCSTCGGMCSHISGRCFRCRAKDPKPAAKAAPAEPTKGPAAGAGATAPGT